MPILWAKKSTMLSSSHRRYMAPTPLTAPFFYTVRLAQNRQRQENLPMKNIEKVFHKFSTLWLKIGG